MPNSQPRLADERPVVWAFFMAFASFAISLALWSLGVEQLARWQGVFPAACLVSGLFVVVSCGVIYRNRRSRRLTGYAVLSTPCLLWAFAIACGL